MKAAVFKQVGKPLCIETREDPVPGGNDVVLKIRRCGICGSDLHMTDGKAYTAPSGSVLGHEYAGEVVAIGKDVKGLKIGDSVTALPLKGCGQCDACRKGEPQWCASGYEWRQGGYAEYVLAGEQSCIKLPSSLSFEDGALVEPLAVALNGVKLSNIHSEAKIIIIGDGPIGLATAFWAKQMGASKTVMLSMSRQRESLAFNMGVSELFINDEAAIRHCRQALGGDADIVYECVGAPGLIARSIELVKARGTVLVVGYCTHPDTFLPSLAISKQLNIQFSVIYGLAEFQTALDTLERGAVDPRVMIGPTVSLAQLPETFESLRTPSEICKVMVDPWR